MNKLFDSILGGNESLFLNPEHLDYSYQPKLVPFREAHQFHIANCIKPLFSRRDGKNILLYGLQGIGKTVSCRHVINELNEETDEIYVAYINCWIDETPYKIILNICSQIGYKWIADKDTKDLISEITSIINKKSIVIVFDEFDKMQDYSLLYAMLEKVYRKCIILITNDISSIKKMEPRIMSRINLDKLEFKPYSFEETRKILLDRKSYAFVSGVFEDDAFDIIAKKAFDLKDIRKGMFLLRESGNLAEEEASRKISVKHAELAISRISEFDSAKFLDKEDSYVLDLIKNNKDKTPKEIYDLYKINNNKSYRTFQRVISRLIAAKAIDDAWSKKNI